MSSSDSERSDFHRPEAGGRGLLTKTLYDELHKLAAVRMSQEPRPQTLQATALVHEAWLKVGANNQPEWANRAQFFPAAAEAMRRILIDRARRRLSFARAWLFREMKEFKNNREI